MKKLLLVLTVFLFAVQMSAQIMPDKQPTFRYANEQELKLLKTSDIWRDIAFSATAFSGCSAAVSLIFYIEKQEAVNRDYDEADKKICMYSAALAGASALLATVSWTMSFNTKHKLPGNVHVVKTSPRGLVIEF